jgi:hypothetical protein
VIEEIGSYDKDKGYINFANGDYYDGSLKIDNNKLYFEGEGYLSFDNDKYAVLGNWRENSLERSPESML